MADNGITITNLPEFRSTLREYREFSKRDDATIVNTKAFYIARGAVRATYRADPNLIDIALNQQIRMTVNGVAKGKHIMVQRFGRHGQVEEAPLVALMINAERGRKGYAGLYGSAMQSAVRGFIPSRKRAAAFIASGWIPSVRKFEPLAERKGSAPPLDHAVKQYGQPKGRAIVARSGDLVPTAILENMAVAKGLTGGTALSKHATQGLQTGFTAEIASMKEYIQQKKQETADKFNAK